MGNTQFKVLSVISSVALAITLTISCFYVRERDPRQDPPVTEKLGVISFFSLLFKFLAHLSPRIRKVYEIQVAAWFGWFSFLFYSTTYIGQLYVNPIFDEHRDLSEHEINDVWEDATRIGTLALFINAVVSFVSNIVLPLLVVPPAESPRIDADVADESNSEQARLMSAAPAVAVPMSDPPADPAVADGVDVTKSQQRTNFVNWRRYIPRITLRRTWLFSHVLFAACMFSTFFISSTVLATVMTGIVGVSWAVTIWAPFAIIASEVARSDSERRINYLHASSAERGLLQPSSGSAGQSHDYDYDEKAVGQAGIVLGLHNVAISFPQIVSTLVSSAIFKALQKPRGEPWDDSVGWVMRFAGCAALVAAFLTKTLQDAVE
jgi:solute carrier family 45, member 1/2/4